MRIPGRDLDCGMTHPLLDDRHADASTGQAGGTGMPQHVWNELVIISHAHMKAYSFPARPEPGGVAAGKQLSAAG